MTKLAMETNDGASLNINKLAQLFPNVVTEKKDKDGKLVKSVNFDALRDALTRVSNVNLSEGREEYYEFSWPGKRKAKFEAAKAIRKTLRPNVESSINWDSTKNLYIEGDNLEALKLLREAYLGKVKMIYIDPPYNTGKDFVYRDDFKSSSVNLFESAGALDESGERMVTNLDTNGRFHSDWCSMIYPRLLVARDLLAEDGVIFISIDENEVHNLGALCSEVFGEQNYSGEIIWKNSSKNDQNYISVQHEYILCYVKNKTVNSGEWKEEKEGLDLINKAFEGFRAVHGNDWPTIHQEALKWYKQFPQSHPVYGSKHYDWMDERGVYFPDNISGPNFGQYVYDVIHPITRKVCKAPASGWRFPEATMKEKINDQLVHFGIDETTVPKNKTYLNNTTMQSLTSLVYQDGRVASNNLRKLMGENVFTNPKGVSVITKLMRAVGIGGNDIVLDFFSGSGTLAEAVIDLNNEIQSNVSFVLVQIPEDLHLALKQAKGGAKQVVKNAIQFCKKNGFPTKLTEIAKERIRRVGKELDTSMDVGFRVFHIDSSNMQDVFYSASDTLQALLDKSADNIKNDRSELDLLYGCLVDWGVELSLPYKREVINSHTVHCVGDNTLIACFDKNVSSELFEEIAKLKPIRLVLRDHCFNGSGEKCNALEIMKKLAPNTDVKVL